MRRDLLLSPDPLPARCLDRLFPPCCVFCGLGKTHVCEGCRDDLARCADACRLCAAPHASGEICVSCRQHKPPFERAVVPLRYAYPLDHAIRRFKFHAALHYVPAFFELLRPGLSRLPMDIDGVQPMPQHWRRHAARGFNQAEELARPVARALGLPLSNSVRRKRYRPPQSGLPAAERKRDFADDFVATVELDEDHLLLVDDVMTTGASVRAVSSCLLRAGARKITVLALARSGDE